MAVCSIDGCGKPHEAKGWCMLHYQRYRRLGDPLAGGTFHGEPARFIRDMAAPALSGDCVAWPFSRNSRGYAVITADRDTRLVSRMVCEERCGPPPTHEHEAAHSCGKGHLGCVSGAHLRWATRGNNLAERFEHAQARGECHPVAKLDAASALHVRAQKGRTPAKDLASAHSVSLSAIYSIWSGRTWAWL